MQIRLLVSAVVGGFVGTSIYLRRRRKPDAPLRPESPYKGSTNSTSLLSITPQTEQWPAARAVSIERGNWELCSQIELGHVLVQLSLAILATLGAEAIHGRQLAVTVAATSALLILGLMASAAIAAAAAAWWQVGRHQVQPLGLQFLEPRFPGSPHARVSDAPDMALATRLSSVAETQSALPPPKQLSGTWDKDKAASDSMESAINAMRLNPIIRRGVSLVRGLEIVVTDEDFYMAVFSAIPWFKVVERYPLTGEDRGFKRRDLRRGGHVGHCEVLPGGQLVIRVKWGQPLGGSGTDTFRIASPGVLHVDTVMTIDGGPVLEYRMIYHIRSQGESGLANH